MDVQVSKTVLSVANDITLFRYIEAGTKLVEAETGTTTNEANTIATKKAIEGAVLELISQGISKGYWKIKQEVTSE